MCHKESVINVYSAFFGTFMFCSSRLITSYIYWTSFCFLSSLISAHHHQWVSTGLRRLLWENMSTKTRESNISLHNTFSHQTTTKSSRSTQAYDRHGGSREKLEAAYSSSSPLPLLHFDFKKHFINLSYILMKVWARPMC